MLILLPAIAAFAAPQVAATLTLGEVRHAERDAAAARALATRVLPADIAATAVDVRVGRRWLPGQYWQLGARDTARPIGEGLCERTRYSVHATAARGTWEEAPDDTVLMLGEREQWAEVAVLPAGMRATQAACAQAAFISARRDRDRMIAAYRVLVAAMDAARGTARLPFAVTCNAEKPAACIDPRKALAALPMTALGGISVTCLESEKRIEMTGPHSALVGCPPLVKGQPYQAEVSFGMSGDDGQSWRVGFVHRPGWPETVALRRSMVIYH